MQLDRFQLSELMESASIAAIARYEAMKEPHKDKLSKKETSDFIRSICTREGLYMPVKNKKGYKETSGAEILKNWIELGYLKGERGKAINSPITFSKAVIIETVGRIKLSRILNPVKLKSADD